MKLRPGSGSCGKSHSQRGDKGLGRSTAPRRGSYDREVAPVGSHEVSGETRVWGGVPLPEREVTTGKWLLWEVTQSARRQGFGEEYRSQKGKLRPGSGSCGKSRSQRGDKGLGRSTAPRR